MKDTFQRVVWVVGLLLLVMWTMVPFTDFLLAIPYKQAIEIMVPYTMLLSICLVGLYVISFLVLKRNKNER